ncbi:MAG: hypothetical protein HZB82_09525 [Deltaproteobacteria bacterium]|nr:hypothetical protein [Deltaproteobacteria bacterium]
MGKTKSQGQSSSISYRAYARYRGVSPEAVSKAVRTGRITVDADGKIDPEKADRQWLENTNPSKALNFASGNSKHRSSSKIAGADTEAAATSPANGLPPFAQSRAIREAYEARLRKLEYEVKIGKLVSADEVRVDAFNIARITRDRLSGIPDMVAPVLVGMNDINEIHRLLSTEIRLACEELTRTRFYTKADKAKE